MSSIPCEELVRRDNPAQPGWSEWGWMRDTANGPEFHSLNYGLESHLSLAESYYHLAAAGLCLVEGQPLAGQAVADEPPPMMADPGQAPSQPIEIAPPPPVEASPENVPPSPWVGTAVIVGVCLLAGAAWISDRRTKATDTTPRPKYPDIFNQE